MARKLEGRSQGCFRDPDVLGLVFRVWGFRGLGFRVWGPLVALVYKVRVEKLTTLSGLAFRFN